jgi:hypothetical protein
MSKQAKIYLYIGIGVVLLIGIVAAIFYFKGKNQVTLQYSPGELPGNPGSGTQYGASNNELKTLSQDLYDEMNGYNILGHDMGPYKRAVYLNDNDLIKLYNTFNTMFQKESDQTLYEWIDNEKFNSHDITDALLAKMAKLNLK